MVYTTHIVLCTRCTLQAVELIWRPEIRSTVWKLVCRSARVKLSERLP